MLETQVKESSQVGVSCTICGKSSATVICMHCFMNYNHKMYVQDNTEEKQAAVIEDNSPVQSNDDDWMNEMETLEPGLRDEEKNTSFSFRSLLSRLPSFE